MQDTMETVKIEPENSEELVVEVALDYSLLKHEDDPLGDAEDSDDPEDTECPEDTEGPEGTECPEGSEDSDGGEDPEGAKGPESTEDNVDPKKAESETSFEFQPVHIKVEPHLSDSEDNKTENEDDDDDDEDEEENTLKTDGKYGWEEGQPLLNIKSEVKDELLHIF
ncbi:acidic leucine-rich nuclear phosphoprotein 32 family member B-like isoform X3 [Periplaneta americana]|uniref:acidic leucine-rich nuclear phosphoprotein 32 family member B-like isoform X3 n=1 Tax=Periplaneta americana TaxID=6978 RepID=UPI0037E9BD9E